MVFTAAFMVAGIASRFGGSIKALAKVGPEGEPLLLHSIKQAMAVGVGRVVLIIGPLTEKALRDSFGTEVLGIPIFYAMQGGVDEGRDRPWGEVCTFACDMSYARMLFVACARVCQLSCVA